MSRLAESRLCILCGVETSRDAHGDEECPVCGKRGPIHAGSEPPRPCLDHIEDPRDRFAHEIDERVERGFGEVARGRECLGGHALPKTTFRGGAIGLDQPVS